MNKFYESKPLHTGTSILNEDCKIPEKGLYALFFKRLPGRVPKRRHFDHTDQKRRRTDYYEREGMNLLYIGIGPQDENSRRTLRDRLCDHFGESTGASTVRLSIAALLNLPLQPGTSRLTGDAAKDLHRWMQNNVRACFLRRKSPEKFEQEYIDALTLPLNIKTRCEFSGVLSFLRKQHLRKYADSRPPEHLR